jgi:protoporphyrinogen/coproporphyrinogen III oxidase
LHVHPLPGLQPLPYSLFSTLTLPLGRLVLKAVLSEPFVSPNRPSPSLLSSGNDEDEGDESVDSFFSRRFGHAFARTLGSAIVHGIYAADSRQLSVRAAFPTLRESEARGNGSVIWGEIGPAAWFGEAARQMRFKALKEDEEEWEIPDEQGEWERSLRGAALFSFREGIETLVRALVDALNGLSNVTLRSGTVVRRVEQNDDDDGSFQVRASLYFFFLLYLISSSLKRGNVLLRFIWEKIQTVLRRSKLRTSSLPFRSPSWILFSRSQVHAPFPTSAQTPIRPSSC